MTYGFRDLGEPKICPLSEAERAITGSREGDEAIVTVDDIEMAEFFNPEGFGIRREPKILEP